MQCSRDLYQCAHCTYTARTPCALPAMPPAASALPTKRPKGRATWMTNVAPLPAPGSRRWGVLKLALPREYPSPGRGPPPTRTRRPEHALAHAHLLQPARGLVLGLGGVRTISSGMPRAMHDRCEVHTRARNGTTPFGRAVLKTRALLRRDAVKQSALQRRWRPNATRARAEMGDRSTGHRTRRRTHLGLRDDLGIRVDL